MESARLICEAIAQRSMATFTYKGEMRKVMPERHGVRTSTGNDTLRAYQIAGGTGNRRGDVGMRTYIIGRMENFAVCGTFVEDPPEYTREDSEISPVHCQLED